MCSEMQGPGLGLVSSGSRGRCTADHIRVRLQHGGYGNVPVPPGLPEPFMSSCPLGQHVGPLEVIPSAVQSGWEVFDENCKFSQRKGAAKSAC